MNLLNYHHLLYFYEIARTGTVLAAAESLQLSQSTLSAQLKQLEQSLGVELFDRQGKRLILTEAGKLAVKYAANIRSNGEEFLAALKGTASMSTATLQIGLIEGVPKNVARNLCRFIFSLDAKTQIFFLEGKAEVLLSDLFSFKLDLVVLNESPASSQLAQAECVKLDHFPVGIFGADRFRSLADHFPQSLSLAPMIFPSHQSHLRVELDNYLRSHGVVPQKAIEVDDIALQEALCADGHGVTALPLFAASEAVKAGSLNCIGILPKVFDVVWLVTHSKRFQNETIAKVMAKFRMKKR